MRPKGFDVRPAMLDRSDRIAQFRRAYSVFQGFVNATEIQRRDGARKEWNAPALAINSAWTASARLSSWFLRRGQLSSSGTI